MMGWGEFGTGWVYKFSEWWDGKALGRAKERLGRIDGGMSFMVRLKG